MDIIPNLAAFRNLLSELEQVAGLPRHKAFVVFLAF